MVSTLSIQKDVSYSFKFFQIRLKKLPYVDIFEITITTDKNTAFVWLDAHSIDGNFSDNGFLLITSTKKVFFYSNATITEDELRSQMTITHIGSKRLSSQMFIYFEKNVNMKFEKIVCCDKDILKSTICFYSS